MLARHSEGVRIQMDRFRCIEGHATGGGFIVVFDEPCGVRQRSESERAEQDGLQVRAGVHSGEV